MRRNHSTKPVIIFLVGPTAVGKTRLGIALGRRVHAEIVSCDSMQVYRGMRVLSQAPSASCLKGVPHHLVRAVSPDTEYNVAQFRAEATKKIRAIVRRGRIPLVVGGSGLYVKVLVDGLFPSPPADSLFRKKMQRIASAHGSPFLHERLLAIDPKAASGIHRNDARRIIRALEVRHTTGRTMTELKRATHGLKEEFLVALFGLTLPRHLLYEAIDRRVERMQSEGLVAEVKRLTGRRLSTTARAVVGLKEVAGYLKGEYGLPEAIELLKKNTRHFAKRQIAWFKPDRRITWFDVSKLSDRKIIGNILRRL